MIRGMIENEKWKFENAMLKGVLHEAKKIIAQMVCLPLRYNCATSGLRGSGRRFHAEARLFTA